jgi:spore coat protein JC
MFQYEKILQYPINIKNPNPKYAQIIISQYGGPDGELGASLRDLSQRFAMPDPKLQGLLTDIGTEELGHLEMIGTLVYQLTRNLTEKEIIAGGFDKYFVNHSDGVYPCSSSGEPFTAMAFASKGDAMANIHEDMAAEQKARAMYDAILKLCDDADVKDVIRFLREREIVHYQRFGEAMEILKTV